MSNLTEKISLLLLSDEEEDTSPIDTIGSIRLAPLCLSVLAMQTSQMLEEHRLYSQHWIRDILKQKDSRVIRRHFRVSRSRFDALAELVAEHRHIHHRDASIRVACTLWRLATGCPVRCCSVTFGMPEATVIRSSLMVFELVCEHLGDVVRFHEQGSRLETESFQVFEQWSNSVHGATRGFTRVKGAIDCTHINMSRAPPASVDHLSYLDRKMRYSMQVQAVCDHRGYFMDIYIGWPGCVHDFRILKNSPLFGRAGGLFQDGSYLLGDAGYGAMPWLIPAFRDVALGVNRTIFNHAHARARGIIERAFGILKARWRILRNVDVALETLPRLIATCFILHNVCIIDGEEDPDGVEPEDGAPAEPPALETGDNVVISRNAGNTARETLVNYVCGL